MLKMSPFLKRVVSGVTSGFLALGVFTTSTATPVTPDPTPPAAVAGSGVESLLPPYTLPALEKLKEPSELSDPKDLYSRMADAAVSLKAAEDAAKKAAAEKAEAKRKAEEAAKAEAEAAREKELAEKEAREQAAREEAARAASDRSPSVESSRSVSDRGTPGLSCVVPSGDGGLNPWVAKVRTRISEQFGVSDIGGTRPGDPQDHGQGLALDVMVPVGSDLGDAVAAWAVENHGALAIKYVIWEQRIWNPSVSGGWRVMEDRGSITENHFDHVHLSFTGATGICP